MVHVKELVQVSEGIGCTLQLTSWMCEADVPTFIHSVKTDSGAVGLYSMFAPGSFTASHCHPKVPVDTD